VISNVAQQLGTQMLNMPVSSGQFGTSMYGATPMGSQIGATTGTGTGFGGTQFGTFGSQFGGNRNDEFARNQQISSMAANRYGAGQLYNNEYAANQYFSNMANQGMLGSSQGNLGTMTQGAGIGATGYASNPAGNYQITPAQQTQSQYGTSGFSTSPFAGQYSTFGNQNAGQYSAGAFGGQNAGRYSNF
jgi:hypothetical protein